MSFSAEVLREAGLALPATTLDMPFGEDVWALRVKGRIFALINPADQRVNLKCDPIWAEVLRQTFAAVIPGYHMNKRHWNTVILDGTVPDDDIQMMLEHAYEQVVRKLPRRERESLPPLRA